MKRTAAVLCVIFSLVLMASGQQSRRASRTVTNADLEKHKQKRLAAEQEYRDNWDRMGFPSPEELDAQRERDLEARLELSSQLRQERLEKERLELERQRLSLDADRLALQRESMQTSYDYDDDGVFWGAYGGFGFSHGGFGKGFRGRSRFGVPLYRVTPAGVFPAGVTQRPRFSPPFSRSNVFPTGSIRTRF